VVVHIQDISSRNICNTIATGGRGWPIASALEEGLRFGHGGIWRGCLKKARSGKFKV